MKFIRIRFHAMDSFSQNQQCHFWTDQYPTYRMRSENVKV
jgi:hypothetical protein